MLTRYAIPRRPAARSGQVRCRCQGLRPSRPSRRPAARPSPAGKQRDNGGEGRERGGEGEWRKGRRRGRRRGAAARLCGRQVEDLGTPMKETGGLSQPLRSLNRPNKTKQKQHKTDLREKKLPGTDDAAWAWAGSVRSARRGHASGCGCAGAAWSFARPEGASGSSNDVGRPREHRALLRVLWAAIVGPCSALRQSVRCVSQ